MISRQDLADQEAAEKIRYARRIFETLRESAVGADMHALDRDSTLNLEFSNGARIRWVEGSVGIVCVSSFLYLV